MYKLNLTNQEKNKKKIKKIAPPIKRGATLKQFKHETI